MTTHSPSEKQTNWTSSGLIARREEICAQFETLLRRWRGGAGPQPRAEDFLAEVPEDHQWEILHCLLLLEEDYRREAGEDDSIIPEFRSRFPVYSSDIALAFPKKGSSTTTQLQSGSDKGHPRRVREYELQERIGQGGMGVVWKAWHVRLKKHRAIKVLHSHMLESTDVRDRFLNEMEALARFEHPNIVRAHDAFEEDGELYLVMEYVDGCDINQLVGKRGSLSVGAACEIIYQAAQGLTALHDQHVTHRDIKPSNLMLTKDPKSNRLVVKVMDLGLSQIDKERGLTHSGDVFGTCEFMAPEQYEDCHDLKPAADVYALGCSLFYLLTGDPPYSAEGSRSAKAVKLMLAHRREPIPRLCEYIPEGDALQPVLDQMMAKTPEARFESALDLRDEIEPFADHGELMAAVGENFDTTASGHQSKETSKLRKPRRRRFARRRRKWILVACLAVALLAVAAVVSISRINAAISKSRLKMLHVQASSVANQYGSEIERRLKMLRTATSDPGLPSLLLATDGAAVQSAEFGALDSWLGNAKLHSGLNSNERLQSTWFITDAHGRQVARVPKEISLGKTDYWTRSYFHGMSADLDVEQDDPNRVSPIRQATVSAPYVSSSEGKWKIAFSSPIFPLATSGENEPIGVLSMSVLLEEFKWFRADVDNSAVTLIELFREDWLQSDMAGQDRIGLIIDHPNLSLAMDEKGDESGLFRIEPELVAQLQDLRGLRVDSFLRGKGRTQCDTCVSQHYVDPVAANPTSLRRAAFESVIVRDFGRNLENLGWMVVVHDFYPSDRLE